VTSKNELEGMYVGGGLVLHPDSFLFWAILASWSLSIPTVLASEIIASIHLVLHFPQKVSGFHSMMSSVCVSDPFRLCPQTCPDTSSGVMKQADDWFCSLLPSSSHDGTIPATAMLLLCNYCLLFSLSICGGNIRTLT
jgi:hypothetical protein